MRGRSGIARIWPSDQRWIVFLPLFWLGWQVLASTQSLDGNLSWPTLRHFVSCVVCFYLGFFVLSRVNELGSFWTGLAAGFLLMLATGWQQHFGGLQATREFFFREIYPHLKEVPPEYLKKMSSNRIFSTLFYPNALAGALLLLLPTMLAVLAQARQRFTLSARRFLVGAIGVGALACLYWSGSKGGWLLLLLLALIALLRVPFNRSVKLAVVVGVLIFGLAGFTWRYAAFFQKGATSVSARFDYWEAGLKTSVAHPWLGTGPGTFFVPSGLPMESKKRWLAYFQRPTGTIFVNARAVPVLREQGRSLLAIGVTGADGDFAAGDVVNIAFDGDQEIFARGKTAFGSEQIAKIAGKSSDDLRPIFPTRKRLEVIHRNDLVVL